MPGAKIDSLYRFLQQQGGRLSWRAREKEFGALTEAEVAAIEAKFRDANPDF